MHLIASIDALAAPWLPPLLRAMAWAAASAMFSMALYAKLSSQAKIKALQAEQKEIRALLLGHDGDWKTLQALITRNLSLALKHFGLIAVPFVVSAGPVLWLMFLLSDMYAQTQLTAFGPEWMRGFEFWYVLTLLIVSLAIKIRYKIA